MDVTTVADDRVVVHHGTQVAQRSGLPSDTQLDLGELGIVDELGLDRSDRDGASVRTLRRPSGQRRCTVATVNDVHFGEVEAGRIDDHPDGPIQRVSPGERPYPETMNGAAAEEIAATAPAAVVVKGDLTDDGHDEEFAAFEACYGRFGPLLHVVRGNHDAYRFQQRYVGDRWIELPGVAIALVDTAIPGATTGTMRRDQLDWLADRAGASTTPVIVMGHHQQWIEGARNPEYFGLDPDASDALDDVAVRCPAIVAYTAGHTHRHRVRTMNRSGIPTVEVGCTKDFPGTWAEYRVFDGGIEQVVHRMSTPEALAWSERCRDLYRDFGVDYAAYALGGLADRCFVIALR